MPLLIMLPMTMPATKIPRLIAHRGASAYAPENTLAAFEKAHAMGARWLEFDVMLTACGTPVVIHDETLNRTTNGQGEVANVNFDKLKQLDAGSWFDPCFCRERVPSFVDVIALLGKYGMGANVEIKPTSGAEVMTAEAVVRTIQQRWPAHCPAPLVSSFSGVSLRTARALDTDLQLGFLLEQWQEEWVKEFQALNCFSFHVNQEEVKSQAQMDFVRQYTSTVLCYTVNDANRAQELFALGVDGVFTNFPDLLT